VTALAIPARVLISTGDVMGDYHAATLVQALLAADDSTEASLPPPQGWLDGQNGV
jgi:hypothetical protein